MSDAPTQLSKADLGVMSPEQIVDALRAGQLHTLLTTADPPLDPVAVAAAHPEGAITEADLKAMTPEAIVEAHRAGKLNHLLGAWPR